MINIRSVNEIEKLSNACKIVKDTLEMLEEFVHPGVTTLVLDKKAESFIRSNNAEPGFKGLYGYPATLCVSIDNEVVHGLPSNRKLEEGQILSVDVGSFKDGFYGDHAKSFAVGKVDEEKQQLIDITHQCLLDAINNAIPGNHIGDIGHAVQTKAESYGYGVVRDLVGHGIGTDLHEEPQIPNYGDKDTGVVIKEGMCFAIEPMINFGSDEIFTKTDNWTVCTKDGCPSAHFEHTITIDKEGPRILTI